jgi:flagellar biosynthetic protein FlhB
MALRGFGTRVYEVLAQGMVEGLSRLGRTDLTVGGMPELFQDWSLLWLRAVLPVAAAILVVGVVAGLLQTQFLFSLKPLVPDFNRINPIHGITRLFSLSAVVDLVKALFKTAVIGYIAYSDILSLLPWMPNLMSQNVAVGIAQVASRALGGLQKMGFGLLALGVLDYGYQYWEFRRSLRMTKQEIKEEMKEQEGSPEVKQKQRARARELARRRKALKEVPTADVVITNPTHYAVALKYEAGSDTAPRVVAKGADLLAQRMKVIARQHDVPLVENKPLARALYQTVEIGKAIPPELYQAVAEVLAFVYSLRRQRRRR